MESQKTDNELIAEFMGERIKLFSGVPRIKTATDGLRSLWSELQYNTSWDWLMRVVEKIRPLWCRNQEEAAANMMTAMFNADIKTTYLYVVEFIKWHNSQNPK